MGGGDECHRGDETSATGSVETSATPWRRRAPSWGADECHQGGADECYQGGERETRVADLWDVGTTSYAEMKMREPRDRTTGKTKMYVS